MGGASFRMLRTAIRRLRPTPRCFPVETVDQAGHLLRLAEQGIRMLERNGNYGE
jgi:hypothetical protein